MRGVQAIIQTRGCPIVHHQYVCFIVGDTEVVDQTGDFPGVDVSVLLHPHRLFPNQLSILRGLRMDLFSTVGREVLGMHVWLAIPGPPYGLLPLPPTKERLRPLVPLPEICMCSLINALASCCEVSNEIDMGDNQVGIGFIQPSSSFGPFVT